MAQKKKKEKTYLEVIVEIQKALKPLGFKIGGFDASNNPLILKLYRSS